MSVSYSFARCTPVSALQWAPKQATSVISEARNAFPVSCTCLNAQGVRSRSSIRCSSNDPSSRNYESGSDSGDEGRKRRSVAERLAHAADSVMKLKQMSFKGLDINSGIELQEETSASTIGDFEVWRMDEVGTSGDSLNGASSSAVSSPERIDGSVGQLAVDDMSTYARSGVTFPSSDLESSKPGSTSATWTPAEVLTIAKEPVYQVMEVNDKGATTEREVSRRQILKISGLRQRDVRRIDPSLWVTNSMPALLVRESAILLNLGSLRAISTADSVLIFDHKSVGGMSFLQTLLERLKFDSDASLVGAGLMVPFELEVVESALISRTQRLESALFDIDPKVVSLLRVLPIKLTADNLEELRLAKQALVELASKAGALRQMLLELLENASDLRRISAISLHCTLNKDGEYECDRSTDQRMAEEEEQEVEMVLEYYLQRCDSVHGQAEKLLDSAKEMEDSISVNLSSRRLEVSRLELLLQVGTFAAALGALVAGIFGMNLRSRLEEHVFAFWLTAGGIVAGGILLFFAMLAYLKLRRIL